MKPTRSLVDIIINIIIWIKLCDGVKKFYKQQKRSLLGFIFIREGVYLYYNQLLRVIFELSLYYILENMSTSELSRKNKLLFVRSVKHLNDDKNKLN